EDEAPCNSVVEGEPAGEPAAAGPPDQGPVEGADNSVAVDIGREVGPGGSQQGGYPVNVHEVDLLVGVDVAQQPVEPPHRLQRPLPVKVEPHLVIAVASDRVTITSDSNGTEVELDHPVDGPEPVRDRHVAAARAVLLEPDQVDPVVRRVSIVDAV